MSTEIVKQENPQSFIERLIEHAEDLEKIKEVGMVIINSGFCPEHFKQSKDAVGAIMCIEAGRKLGLTWMQSLSDIYPVKGRIGIMGSAARAVIFSSGVLDKWEELTEGVYPEDTYKHIIISKRKGLPGEFRSEFSVYDAKKAGLFTKDIYQRYGKRLIMWRNIGFHSTDYYGDIMKGMKTVEELTDFDIIPGVGDTTIEKEDGTKINITGGSKQKSTKMTDRVTDKIPDNKFGAVKTENIQEAEVVTEPVTTLNNVMDAMKTPENTEASPFIPDKKSIEYMNGITVIRDAETNEITNMEEIDAAGKAGNEAPPEADKYTLKQMEDMDSKVLLQIVNDDMDMMEAAEMIGGKNTNKKLREIIFAHQHGQLAEHVAKNMPKDEPPVQGSQQQGNVPTGEIQPHKDFDKQGSAPTKVNDDFFGKKDESKIVSGNKYNIIVPEFDKGDSRDFATLKPLFNKLMGITPQITTPRYLVLAEKAGLLTKYSDKESFLKLASISEINNLLNSN